MNRVLNTFLALTLITSTTLSAREEHPLSTIQGTNIDLKVYDHAFAGSIKDFVAWGALDESTGKSELIIRRDGQIIRSAFGKFEGKVGGVIRHQTNGKIIETRMLFDRLDKSTNTFYVTVNGISVPVEVRSENFQNNHFIKPTYTTTLAGEKVSFTLEGQACYGYSLHLILMIIGAYAH